MPDNRPAVYLEDERVIYRASALGHCLRALWAARNNMERRPLPQVVQQGMDEGTNLEPIILDLLFEKYGFTFADGSQSQVELNVGAWNGKTLIVRGKLDEIGCRYDDSLSRESQQHRPIDVKALPQDAVEKYRTRGLMAFPAYAWQQSVYAHGYGSDSFYMPIFHKGTWEIEEWTLEPIAPPYTVDQIRDRVLQVEEAYADNVMPEECDGDFGCPYFYLHEQKPVDELPEESVLLVSARIKLGKRETILKNAKAEIDKKLKELLTQDMTYHFDGYTISVFGNPRRFNTDKAKAILTEAEIDWESDDLFWIPGKGTQVRFNPPKKGGGDEVAL
jgi:hypothetical protein